MNRGLFLPGWQRQSGRGIGADDSEYDYHPQRTSHTLAPPSTLSRRCTQCGRNGGRRRARRASLGDYGLGVRDGGRSCHRGRRSDTLHLGGRGRVNLENGQSCRLPLSGGTRNHSASGPRYGARDYRCDRLNGQGSGLRLRFRQSRGLCDRRGLGCCNRGRRGQSLG